MEKSLNLLLSFLFIFSCAEPQMNKIEKIELAKMKWKVMENQTKHDGHQTQGSSHIMNLLEDIIALDPNHCDALRERSVPYLKRGIPHIWKEYMDQAVTCDSSRWIGWRGHHYLYFYRDYRKAIADFNATDRLTPNFIDAPRGHSVDYWRGHAYLGLKDFKNTIYYYLKHIEKVTIDFGEEWVEPNAFLNLGVAYLESNQYDNATEQLKKALKYFNNQSADTKYYWAILEESLGNNKKALIWIDQAIDDFLAGHYQKKNYNEEIGQIYLEELHEFKKYLINKKPLK
ncbi:MAG: Uncharacterised protein [Bacteroidetes bacterium MED-G17]|nr:MAG: Uncharacterised protein [Bacteroidetes bacterium MED-G17]